jgi:DNA-binding CsgD family transcriptional regulator
MPKLLKEAQDIGDAMRMPYIAAQADLADPKPMSDEFGQPYAVTTFRWVNPTNEYWLDRKLALTEPLLTAARLIGEPFYYSDGALMMHRPSRILDAIDCSQAQDSPYLSEAIVAPVHLPRAMVGAMLWCSREPVGVAKQFAQHASLLHNIAIRLFATHHEARGRPRNFTMPQRLTRREAQCLRWAAAGKTDGEIGIILDLSVSTVRFHLRNAAGKLGASGRTQSIQLAAGMGYIGAI